MFFFSKKSGSELDLQFDDKPELTGKGVLVALTFTATVLLWLTSGFHGIPSSVVALFPIIVFTATEVLEPSDINNLNWNVLILLSGAITLGTTVKLAELDQWLINFVPVEVLGPIVLTTMFVVAIIALSNFMSNTAAASLMIPIVIGIPGLPVVYSIVCIAFGASMAMALPVSTPPNTMAYATDEVSTWEMFVPGLVMSSISGLSIILFGYPVLRFWGFV